MDLFLGLFDFFTPQVLEMPLIIVQLLICPILTLLILLQSGKSDDLGSALGGGGSGSSTVLGTGGASKVLVKATVFFAVFFMVNSVALAWVYKEISRSSLTDGTNESLLTEEEEKALEEGGMGTEDPATPAESEMGSPETQEPAPQ